MGKCEFYDQMKKSSILIDKRPNEEIENVRITADGEMGAVYGILANVITKLANHSEASLYACWCMVNAIRDEIAENDKNMEIIDKFIDDSVMDDEDSEGGLISED